MVTLDRDYTKLLPYLRAECDRRKIGFQFEELNPGGWGDCFWVGANGLHNVEIKEQGEAIGNMDHLINQIKAQSAKSDFMWCFVYGNAEEAEDGNSYSLRPTESRILRNRDGVEYAFQRTFKRRHYRVNYVGQRKILWRFREVGVQVIEVKTLEDLAFELCTAYECSQSEGSTFSRLIVERIRIGKYSPEKEAFMRQVMGLGAGFAEETAEALAEWMTVQHTTLNIASLVDELDEQYNWDTLAAQPLRSSLTSGRKQTIGKARVEKLKTALGI